MSKILILFAHPAFHKSFSNQVLVEDINKINGITFHDLYEEYPEFDIDVEREKELLSHHDCIIFHHPFFWYSTPAILKEWQDLVLEHGWAFGTGGDKLRGKLFFNTITVGGPKEAYTRDGMQNNTIRELIAPLKQTAVFCNMVPLPPFVVYGTHAIEKEELQAYKNSYHRLLKNIVADKIDIKKMDTYESLLEYINEEEN
jgi:glutathione-regulated potassium-efflux system ancillary protein KefG